ncbi:MAG: polyprenyl synthetase family protein [Pseudomonadota bacterium]
MSGQPAIVADTVSKAAARDGALGSVYALVARDFAAVNELIPRQLTSDVNLVEEIGHHIIGGGGKRLRPLLVLLGARACGYDGSAHVRLAAIIEFLHTATLLHDDVVDHSDRRRGRATANATWGNPPSVLVGDFLYSRAFQLMVELQDMDIMAILSDATNTIAEGEVLQLANVGNVALTESEYLRVIRCKTALLFQAATHTAGVLSSDNPEEIQALKRFGVHFGMAYQLVDDYLDYAGDAEVMGKNVGDDLSEGKLTLPLIHALARSEPAGAVIIRDALTARSTERLDEVLSVVRSSGALDYVQHVAQSEGERARASLESLEPSAYREALERLVDYSTSRIR